MVPSAGPSIVVGSMEMLCRADSRVKSWGPTRNGPLLSCPCLLDLETCKVLDKAQDEALDEDCDAHEDALDDALEVDLLITEAYSPMDKWERSCSVLVF